MTHQGSIWNITWSDYVLQRTIQAFDISRLVQNEYDMCTFNKMVNGEQITVKFHVNDLKVSHNDQAVLEDFLSDLMSEFGQGNKLTENKELVYK